MATNAFDLAEAALPGWKAVRSSGRADSKKQASAQNVDARGVDVAELRAKYFGPRHKAPVADAATQAMDGQLVKMKSGAKSSGPNELRVLISNEKVTGIQG